MCMSATDCACGARRSYATSLAMLAVVVSSLSTGGMVSMSYPRGRGGAMVLLYMVASGTSFTISATVEMKVDNSM